MIIEHGITRSVLLVGQWAIKFPTVRYGWDKFLRGLLSNMTERSFSTMAAEMHLCPVTWSAWGGWVNVMRRCDPLDDDQWLMIAMRGEDWFGFRCDHKRDNYGSLDGGVVLLDYGEVT